MDDEYKGTVKRSTIIDSSRLSYQLHTLLSNVIFQLCKTTVLSMPLINYFLMNKLSIQILYQELGKPFTDLIIFFSEPGFELGIYVL